jgi:hypothetical protein
LNWYRNIKRPSELLAPWRGWVIRQPSLFIAFATQKVVTVQVFGRRHAETIDAR